jgi:TonB family protein
MITTLLLALALLPTPYEPCGWFPAVIEGPIYPVLATQAGIEGTVKVRISLDGDGKVSAVEAASGHRLLADAATENVRSWVFVRCGEAASNIEFTYAFKLEGETYARPRTRFRYEHPYRVTVTAEAQHWMPSQSRPRGNGK